MASLILSIVSLVIALISLGVAFWLYLCANARADLIAHIKEVLEECRRCESWDDRSELKLFSYIGAEEKRLQSYRLKALVEIRNRAYDYLYVHQKMDDEDAERIYNSPYCTWWQFLRYEVLGAKAGELAI